MPRVNPKKGRLSAQRTIRYSEIKFFVDKRGIGSFRRHGRFSPALKPKAIDRMMPKFVKVYKSYRSKRAEAETIDRYQARYGFDKWLNKLKREKPKEYDKYMSDRHHIHYIGNKKWIGDIKSEYKRGIKRTKRAGVKYSDLSKKYKTQNIRSQLRFKIVLFTDEDTYGNKHTPLWFIFNGVKQVQGKKVLFNTLAKMMQTRISTALKAGSTDRGILDLISSLSRKKDGCNYFEAVALAKKMINQCLFTEKWQLDSEYYGYIVYDVGTRDVFDARNGNPLGG